MIKLYIGSCRSALLTDNKRLIRFILLFLSMKESNNTLINVFKRL